MNRLRHTSTFPSQHQDIARHKSKIDMANGSMRRQQDDSRAPVIAPARRLECRKADMPRQIDMIEIIKPCAPERSVAHIESGWPDDIDRDAKACRHSQDSTRILWNVGLVER